MKQAIDELKRLRSILSGITGFEDDDQEYIEDARKSVDRIIEALAEQPAPVQGWKLVPVEPTPEQIKEGNKVTWPLPCAQVYSAMLAAAPQPAPPPQRKPLTDEQIDAAVKAWFENDISPGRQPFEKRMRAAIKAAHGITEKGGAA